MELRMNFVTFIKLKDIIKVNDINGEIVDYEVIESEIKGKFGINGKYSKSDLDEVTNFNEEIDFNILLLEENFEIDDIDCIDLNYNVIEGRGIDVSFDVKVDYTCFEQNEDSLLEVEEVKVEELPNETVTEDVEEENIEEIKEEITNEIDKKLTNTLLYKEDNLPQGNDLIDLKDVKRAKIKVCYFKNDNELEEVCKNNNIAIDQVFKSNINNDINKYRRVIIR